MTALTTYLLRRISKTVDYKGSKCNPLSFVINDDQDPSMSQEDNTTTELTCLTGFYEPPFQNLFAG